MSFEWVTAAWAWPGAGVLMLVLAVTWRVARRRRISSRLAAMLRDPDPAHRRAAVQVATEQGLRAHAALLSVRVDVETDPVVRAALAEGVLRNAWEPADRPAILRLRLWAHEEQARRSGAPGAPGALNTSGQNLAGPNPAGRNSGSLPLAPRPQPVRPPLDTSVSSPTTQLVPLTPRPYAVPATALPPVPAPPAPGMPRRRQQRPAPAVRPPAAQSMPPLQPRLPAQGRPRHRAAPPGPFSVVAEGPRAVAEGHR